MPDAACRYSSSEIELCGLKKAILHFQYLLKYANFTVIIDHRSLKFIYKSKKPAKTNRIKKYLEELLDYSFTFEHIPGTKMFISYYLSRFSTGNNETESIPFLTNRNNLTGNLYFNEIFSDGHDQVSDHLEEQDAHCCPEYFSSRHISRYSCYQKK